uniref:Uncharacterized protein n=1 Tax=Panagrolaimus sp. ES5 TaxID=591445 RepID=A0AC34G5A5_9BILA
METNNFPESKKRKLSTILENGDSMASKFAEMKAENEKLKQFIEKQNATIIDLAMDNTELKKEKMNHSKLLKEYESEINRLKPRADELEKMNSILEQKEIKTKAAIAKYKTRILCMNVDFVRMKIVGEQIQAGLKRNYECKIDHLESNIDNLMKKNLDMNQTMEKERKEFKAKIKALKSGADKDYDMKE